ncbi:hypothetical protein KIL84_006276, partial [Mauremys mutica]
CAYRGIIQEPQPEEKLAQVDLSSLDIAVSRDERFSAFCLMHQWLGFSTERKEVEGQSPLSSCSEHC